MGRLEKVFWAVVAGAALVSTGCSSEPLYGVPSDTSMDAEPDPAGDAGDEALEDVLEDVNEEEMPATEYGPPPDM